MPVTASLSVSQGIDPTTFTLTDTTNYSVETKSTYTGRSITIYKSDGTVYRQPGQLTDAIDFSFTTYSSDQINITGLEKDYAFTIVMTLAKTSPVNGSVYIASIYKSFVAYTSNQFTERLKKIAENTRYESNKDYVNDLKLISLYKKGSTDAAALQDVKGAQMFLDKAKRITDLNQLPY